MLGGQTRKGSPLGLTISAGIVLLFVVGIIFSVSRSTSDIVADADALHDADEALRGVTVVRAQIELVSLQSAVRAEPTPVELQAIEAGLIETESAIEIARLGLDALAEHNTSTALTDLAESYFESAADAVAVLRAGDEPELSDFRFISDRVVVEVSGSRGLLADSVADADRGLTSLGSLASFLVAFAIPAGILLVYRELSRRQSRQRELEVHLDAERSINAGREEFIATASHELRSPLTAVLGMAHLLAEDPTIMSDPTAAEMIGVMIDQAEDLTRLVEDLLTASRIEAGAIHYAFEDVPVLEDIPALVEAFDVTDETISVNLEPGVIRVDRLRLRQMVRNLVSNARKYGGRTIEIEGRRRFDSYVISVIDDGPGVPDEISPRLFERFIHRGKETAGKQSVGLGLSIVMALAVGMGGTVFYDRRDDRTNFSLVVPLAQTESEYPSAPISTSSLAS